VNRVVSDLNSTTRCETCDAMRANTVDEPERTPAATTPLPEPIPANNTSYPRINSDFELADFGGENVPRDGYKTRFIQKRSTGEKAPGGFSFTQNNQDPYLNVQSPYLNGGPPKRNFEMVSINNAFNETYLYFEEAAGGPDSHNVKSYMFVIPRKTVPSVRTEGNNLILTLPTGETVTMDKNSRAILGGALTEGPIEMSTDRFKRKPPNINYSGSGISIRLDHRFEHPLIGCETATVKQGNRTCTIKRTAILDENGKMKTSSDADLLSVLNRNCTGGGFRLP
ncbi:MAG: hypothetical protein ACJ76H_08160, partial [Bacteriovoracaceae bacterium]